MIINVQKLRSMFDALELRVKTLESEVDYLKRGKIPPAPEPLPAPEPEPAKQPDGGSRFWGSGAGQFDAASSRRWRNR